MCQRVIASLQLNVNVTVAIHEWYVQATAMLLRGPYFLHDT